MVRRIRLLASILGGRRSPAPVIVGWVRRRRPRFAGGSLTLAMGAGAGRIRPSHTWDPLLTRLDQWTRRRVALGCEVAPGGVTDRTWKLPGGGYGDATGRGGTDSDRDHQPDPPTPTGLASPSGPGPMGSGHRL